MFYDIEEIKKIVIEPGECLLVRVDVGQLEYREIQMRLAQVAKLLKESLPEGAKFIIAPKGQFEFEKVTFNKAEEKGEDWFGGGTIFSWKMGSGDA